MQCLLIGNFGVGNLGDEALKHYFIEAFPTIDWTIVSAHPKAQNEVSRLPAGLRSLLRFRWIQTLSAYRCCDAVVYGGGSLFTDVESVSACILWWIHSVPARLFRKPIHLAFQGIGPFRTRAGEWCARSVLCLASSISVRDNASKMRAELLTKSTKIVQSSDPVIALIKKQKVDIRTENVLVLIPRKNSSEKFTKVAQNTAKSRVWDKIHVISMEPDNPSEQQYVKSLIETLGGSVSLHNVQTLSELLSHIAPAAQVVSERYHGALPAILFGKKVDIISQKPGDKLDGLREAQLSVNLIEDGKALLQESLGLH
ncbi:polysaccharide pyruvyl transferase family protein [Candidatus Peribacteria bacterium]|nr:polysaccharide pyruvyl transferase family protein [Candidatus Peribacteria bacterium]